MAPVRGPAVPRRRLGAELRRLREEAGLLLDHVASALEMSASKISRLENGKGIPRGRDVRDMLDLYRVSDQRVRDRCGRWVRDGQQQGWWHSYADILDEKRETFVALEADAVHMRSFEPSLVHGLLQTPDYARAIGEMFNEGASTADIDLFVELRMQRQNILHRADGALQLHVVMEEPALYRPIGGVDVLKAQLRSLLKVAERPNVTIQVLPLSVALHPGLVGPFALLEFPPEVDHGAVLGEGVGGIVILEADRDVSDYSKKFDTIRRRALNEQESLEFIASVLQGTD